MKNKDGDLQNSGEEMETPASKVLKALTDGRLLASCLDDYPYEETLTILDSLTAEIREKGHGNKGYMDSAEDKGTRITFERKRKGVFYPYRKAGLDEQGCRVIMYPKNSLVGIRLEQFIEDKVRFFEGLNKSAEAEFLRQNLFTFNESQLAELLKKHDSTFSRDTVKLQRKLKNQYQKRRSESKE